MRRGLDGAIAAGFDVRASLDRWPRVRAHIYSTTFVLKRYATYRALLRVKDSMVSFFTGSIDAVVVMVVVVVDFGFVPVGLIYG